MGYRTCWLCGRTGGGDPLDKHHIFGGTNRKKSEKYGLTVYLCHGRCHLYGERAAHNCRETMEELHRRGQEKAMREQGWTRDEFREVFGRNYLEEEPEAEEAEPGYFQLTDDELDITW